MIAIDTLVHNFLHRTGILARFEPTTPMARPATRLAAAPTLSRPWPPGSTPGSSIRVSAAVSRGSSSTRSGGTAPSPGLDVCNGNRIDDRKSCDNIYCQIRSNCDRIVLNNVKVIISIIYTYCISIQFV